MTGFWVLYSECPAGASRQSVTICWEKEKTIVKIICPGLGRRVICNGLHVSTAPHPWGRRLGAGLPSGREGGRGRGLLFPSGSSCWAVSWEAGVALLPVGLLFAQLFWPAPCCQDCHPGNLGGTWPASESAGVSPAVGPPHGPSTGITLVERDVFGGILNLRSSLSLVRVT